MSDMEGLSLQDYIEVCKEAGNYKQAIFWCDVASAQESEDVECEEPVCRGPGDGQTDPDEKTQIPPVRGQKSVEYLLEMAALYMLDGREVCVESVLRRIRAEDLEMSESCENDENVSGRAENQQSSQEPEAGDGFSYSKLIDRMEEDIRMDCETNPLLSKKLLLEAQYLHSVHRYEECLSLIESSIDLSSFDAFVLPCMSPTTPWRPWTTCWSSRTPPTPPRRLS
ncbi:transmembrane domain-containing protein [Cryptosporidium canis]|nr:transmembrane domain-containing protein [Cryptosporidium canis]